jgi:hypothetical protein
MEACVADIQAVFERDAACDRYTQCILYFKGFQAIQCHRIAHWLWTRNRRVRPRAAQPFPARGSLLGSAVQHGDALHQLQVQYGRAGLKKGSMRGAEDCVVVASLGTE